MKVIEIENGVVIEEIEHFDAKHILECGQCFRWSRQEDGSYTGIAFEKVINVKSDYEDKKVVIKNTNISDFNSIWFDYFDFGRDYGKIKRALSEDTVMKEAISYGQGMRILKQQPWELVISYIISANNNIPRISKSINKLSEMYGKAVEYDGNIYYSFPSIEQLEQALLEDLMVCKAGFRCKYIYETVSTIHKRLIVLEDIEKMSTQEARKELMKLSGVGPKVADCILLFSMGKYDAYPIDVWVKRVTEHFYLGKNAKFNEIQSFAEQKFGQLAGFAQEYLFYYAREKKINIK